MKTQNFDAIIIGAGQAGPSLAARLAGSGQSVALIERQLLGGTCVNTGCTPTKALVASARVIHQARRAADYGIAITGSISADFPSVMSRKQSIVEASRSGLDEWLNQTRGLTLFNGHARFLDNNTLQVGAMRLKAPKIFINVGGRAAIPPYPGIADITPLTNSSMLALEVLPDHLVIIGGGYIGLEFAQIFRRFGSAVTLLERGNRLLRHEDADAAAVMEALFAAENIDVRRNASNIGFAATTEGPIVSFTDETGRKELACSHVMLAVGRRPNTDDLGLESTDLILDGKGYIQTNERLETSVEGIWALGDCNGRGAFTHTSYNDYEIVADNLLTGSARTTGQRPAAYALYTDPPMGRVGMTLSEAHAAGHRVLVGKRPMTRVARAVEKGETQGFMKALVDADTDAILGATILGTGGDEVVHILLDAIQSGTTASALRQTMHIHPTVSELIPTILGELVPAE